MEKLRGRILNYLREGQSLDPYLSEEITTNLLDVLDEWLKDVTYPMPSSNEILYELREEM